MTLALAMMTGMIGFAAPAWAPTDQLQISVWGRNLTDAKYATSRSESSARDAIAWAQPITYGVSASYGF